MTSGLVFLLVLLVSILVVQPEHRSTFDLGNVIFADFRAPLRSLEGLNGSGYRIIRGRLKSKA